jgi:cytochrome d ubiquinol oxidase subunit I
MSVETLARFQFGLTSAFHYIFPPLSIGLGLILMIMEGLYLKTNNVLYHDMTRFWVKIFAIIFGLGVATGIVLEFEFGTNWAAYSRYVGDIFGSALAAEGIFAFFLESGFLAVLVFGWDRVSPKVHFLSTVMVSLGSTFSAVWIVVANSWQQTPAGYVLVTEGGKTKAHITDFWAMVFNPSSMERLNHTVSSAWMTGAFFVISVSAFYLLKKRHEEFAKASMRIGLAVALAASLLQLLTGHQSADGVYRNQPAKLAAIEGHYDSRLPGDEYLFGYVDESTEKVTGLKIPIPGFTSWLIYQDSHHPITGLDKFAPADRPPVNRVFQTFHLMVGIGFGLIGVSLLAVFMMWRGTLWTNRPMLMLLVISVLGPQIANQAGWMTAEFGRQPWIVYNQLRTSDGLSKVVQANQVLSSIIIFSLLYLLLFVLFINMLNSKITEGPVAPAERFDSLSGPGI